MIEYTKSWWGLPLVMRLYGSAFPRTMPASAFSAVFTALLLRYVGDEAKAMWLNPYPYQVFTFFVSFILAFRSQLSYSRYWEGATALRTFSARLANAVMQLLAFERYGSPPGLGQQQQQQQQLPPACGGAGAAALRRSGDDTINGGGGGGGGDSSMRRAVSVDRPPFRSASFDPVLLQNQQQQPAGFGAQHGVAGSGAGRKGGVPQPQPQRSYQRGMSSVSEYDDGFAAAGSELGEARGTEGSGAAAAAAAAASCCWAPPWGGARQQQHQPPAPAAAAQAGEPGGAALQPCSGPQAARPEGDDSSGARGRAAGRRLNASVRVGVSEAPVPDGEMQCVNDRPAAAPSQQQRQQQEEEVSRPAGAVCESEGDREGEGVSTLQASAPLPDPQEQQQRLRASFNPERTSYSSDWSTHQPQQQQPRPASQPSMLRGAAGAAGGGGSTRGSDPSEAFVQRLLHVTSLLHAVACQRLRHDSGVLQNIVQYSSMKEEPPTDAIDLDREEMEQHRPYRVASERSSQFSLGRISWLDLFLLRGTERHLARYNAAMPLPVIWRLTRGEAAALEAVSAAGTAHGAAGETSYHHVHMVASWMHQLVLERRAAGGLRVEAPLLQAAFTAISNALEAYEQCEKLVDIPFPFPWAQFVLVLLLVHSVSVPLVIIAFIKSIWLAVVLSVLVNATYWAVNEVARDIEDPFVYDPNDLPLAHMQYVFNERLMSIAYARHP